MAARLALCALLERLGTYDADEALLEYICTLLEDAGDDDAGSEALLDQTRELLAEIAPRFTSAHTSARQQQMVLDLFEAARSGSNNGSNSSSSSGEPHVPSPSDTVTAEALVASLRQLEIDALACESTSGALRTGSGKVGRTASGTGHSHAHDVSTAAGDGIENADPGTVAALRELCSGAPSDAFLAHVLARRCCGDAEAAAGWLVEHDLDREEAAWRQEQDEGRQEAQRSERERQKSKQALLARFALEAVPVPTDGKQKARPVEAWAAGKKQQQPSGKVRYLEGRVVSSTGQKYIVEKAEEYDGGSRGKVYTKGKRGKGFV